MRNLSNNNNNDDDDIENNSVSTSCSSKIDFEIESKNDIETGTTLELGVRPRNDIIGLDAGVSTTQICASIKACDLLEEVTERKSRAPVDIVVALDVSLSMNGEKLDLCKKTLEFLIRELRVGDRFGLVSFATDARLDIPLDFVGTAIESEIFEVIHDLDCRGSTCLSGGIAIAAGELNSVDFPNPVQSIFLLTDGNATTGIVRSREIVNMTMGLLNQSSSLKSDDEQTVRTPVTIQTFGYGTDHNAKLLADIAQLKPGGSYYFVKNNSDVISAFGDALGGILSVVAQNVILTISIPPEMTTFFGVHLDTVHHHSATLDESTTSTSVIKVSIGDLYAQEERDIIFEVSLANTKSLRDDNNEDNNNKVKNPSSSHRSIVLTHATVSLTYFDTIHHKIITTDTIAADIYRPSNADVSGDDRHVVAQWHRICATKLMDQVEAFVKKNDFQAAQQLISDFQLSLVIFDTTFSADEDNDKAQKDKLLVNQLQMDMKELMLGVKNRSEYNKIGGSQFVQSRTLSHKMQRSMATYGSEYIDIYRNKMKTDTLRKWERY